MALSNDDFYKNRGIDSRAAATLKAKKEGAARREDDLKRKQIQREIDSLKSRISIIDREIERLSVSERRYKGDEARAKLEFEKESREMLELTRDLQVHSSKVEQLKSLLNSKKITAGRSSSKKDFGRDAIERDSQRLKTELRQIDQEIDQLNGKKRRIVSEMSSFQTKMQSVVNLENKEVSESRRQQEEMEKIFQELQSEESIIERFKSRFTKEKRESTEKEKELSAVRGRMQGASAGAPALESEKMRIERQIQELERRANQNG